MDIYMKNLKHVRKLDNKSISEMNDEHRVNDHDFHDYVHVYENEKVILRIDLTN